MRINLNHVCVSEDGDYFQVLFETEHKNDGAYVLVQRQFEDPDDEYCYIETHDKDYIGHCRIAYASLRGTTFFCNYSAIKRHE